LYPFLYNPYQAGQLVMALAASSDQIYKLSFQVEQRRKEALSQDGDNSSNVLEGSLQQLIARYQFLDLWPCTSTDLDHLSRQQVLLENATCPLQLRLVMV
jgi:hypothetical protein